MRSRLLQGAVLALLACSAVLVKAEGEATAPAMEGKVLIPADEKDYSNMLSGMMEHQVSLLEKVHGADSPYVSLASSLMDLQSMVGSFVTNITSDYANFVKFVTTAPTFFNQLSADAGLINRQLNATIFAISPNLGRVVFLSAPIWFQNNPKTITTSFTGVNVAERFFNIAPCLFALSQQGIQVESELIFISPRLIQTDALGVQVQPELITVNPTLIAISPQGVSASPVNVQVSPVFLTVNPTVKVIPNSNKAPTLSAGIAIKPNPDRPVITNAYGKVLNPAPSPPAKAAATTATSPTAPATSTLNTASSASTNAGATPITGK
jgi:hypothetical protein